MSDHAGDGRLRVLTVAPDLDFGGGENRILTLARTIDRSRFAHRVATLYSPLPERTRQCGSMREAFADAGVPVLDLALPRPVRRSRVRAVQLASTAARLGGAVLRLRRFLVEERIDLLDAHLDSVVYASVAAARAARVPVALTLYCVYHPASRWHRARRTSLRAANAIFTDSRALAAGLGTVVGRRRPPVWVIPNGVRLGPPARPRADVLAALRLPPDARTIVGQVSGMHPTKGHRTVLRAAARVLGRHPDTYFLLVGFPRAGDDYVASLEAEARSLGIADRVRIAPYPGSIADVWQVVDLHVHASEVDSLPNAIIEGMSLGRPAIVTAVGGIPELVDDGRTGLVVPPADPEALAAALLRMQDDPELAGRLGAAARQRYLERCTPEITVRELERRFEEIHRTHVPRGAGARA